MRKVATKAILHATAAFSDLPLDNFDCRFGSRFAFWGVQNPSLPLEGNAPLSESFAPSVLPASVLPAEIGRARRHPWTFHWAALTVFFVPVTRGTKS